MTHLLACVSSHGWGHLAQTVPIIAALRARLPGLEVTVRSGLDPTLLRARFAAAGQPEPRVVADDTDFGFEMHDALRVDDERSLRRYRALHDDGGWLERERAALRTLRVDVVLSNVGYMPLAAAASLGLPAFGACSLNWADVLGALYAGRADVAPIVRAMREAYEAADLLFALEPGMPFAGFARRVPVAPIGRRGRARRAALREVLGVPPGQRVMLVAFGGLPMALDTGRWRLPPGWTAVAFTDAVSQTAAVRDGARLEGWPYIDLLASCDLLVAKPGYGTFAEAGFEARDTLVVPRDTWPEAPWLVDWLSRHARCAPIALDMLRAGRFEAALAAIEAQAPRPAAQGDGAAQIAAHVARRLGAA
jgi:hypothetical protein